MASRELDRNIPNSKNHSTIGGQSRRGFYPNSKVQLGSAESLRILIQNRPNTFTQRGGDSVQVELLSEGLRARGCEVVVDLNGSQDPGGFDLVHLYNFATTEYTEQLAKRAYAAGVPYVVTTLYEEVQFFHNQSHLVAQYLFDYIRAGQSKRWWERAVLDLSAAPMARRFPADWIVSHAAALFPNGSRETASIKRDFPDAENLIEIPLGHEVGALVGPEQFIAEYGIRDFVFCVGRFETRKNQLMLLRALEDSDIPVVLASGGFTYQPEYDQAIRNFKRKGQTIIIERVSPEMLSSAYAACRIHALPSWYELPGHVSLEAAAHGRNIVVTDTGTQPDYFGTNAFYCQPWDIESIEAAVLAAWNAPVPEGLARVAKSYSWETTVDKTLEAYRSVVTRTGHVSAEISSAPQSNAQQDSREVEGVVEALLGQAQNAARSGDMMTAQRIASELSERHPDDLDVLRLQGGLFMVTGRFDEAQHALGRALELLSGDSDLVTAFMVSVSRGECGVRPLTAAVKLFGPADGATNAKSQADVVHSKDALADIAKPSQRPASEVTHHSQSSTVDSRPSLGDKEIENTLAEAELLTQRGEYANAHKMLDRIIGINPTNVRALRSKATTFLVDRKAPEAIPLFEAVIAIDPVDTRALTGLGMSHVALRQHAAAYSYLVRALRGDPSQSIALINLMECSYILNRFDDLLLALETHLNSHPRDKEMRYCYAAALYRSGKITEAKHEVEVVLREDSSHRGANELVGILGSVNESPQQTDGKGGSIDEQIGELEILKKRHEYSTILQRCDQLLTQTVTDGTLRERIMILKAESHALSGDEEDAKAVYSRVLESNPQSSRALSGQGALAAYRSGWERAEELFSRARDLDHRNDAAWAGLGLCARHGGRWEDSWNAFLRSLDINPENLGALYGAIDVGYHLGRLADIEKLICDYLNLHSGDVELLLSLGECLLAQGKQSEAEACLEKLGSLEPNGERYRQLAVRLAESRVGSENRQ
jgi:tetratricopeptide (TPR) repeat protein